MRVRVVCVGVSDGVGDDGLSDDEQFHKAARQPKVAGPVTETVQCGTARHRAPLSRPNTPVFLIGWHFPALSARRGVGVMISTVASAAGGTKLATQGSVGKMRLRRTKETGQRIINIKDE